MLRAAGRPDSGRALSSVVKGVIACPVLAGLSFPLAMTIYFSREQAEPEQRASAPRFRELIFAGGCGKMGQSEEVAFHEFQQAVRR